MKQRKTKEIETQRVFASFDLAASVKPLAINKVSDLKKVPVEFHNNPYENGVFHVLLAFFW